MHFCTRTSFVALAQIHGDEEFGRRWFCIDQTPVEQHFQMVFHFRIIFEVSFGHLLRIEFGLFHAEIAHVLLIQSHGNVYTYRTNLFVYQSLPVREGVDQYTNKPPVRIEKPKVTDCVKVMEQLVIRHGRHHHFPYVDVLQQMRWYLR